jgi:hypothetical protein
MSSEENLAKQSMQTLFDTAVKAVWEQGAKSWDDVQGMCMYRHGNLKCAVGHVLTDEQIQKYDVREDVNPWHFNQELLKELLPGVYILDASAFLADLQRAHDKSPKGDTFASEFLKHANVVARIHSLVEWTPPTK